MPDNAIAFLVTLHGKVQGIGLRKRIRATALEGSVVGWVRNRKAGHVQAHLEGRSDSVRRIIADLQLQVIKAEITDFVISQAEPVGYESFTIVERGDSGRILDGLIDAALARASLLTRESRDLDKFLLESVRHTPEEKANDLKRLAQEIPSRHLGEPLVQRQKSLAFPLPEVICSFASESWAQRVVNATLSRSGVKSAETLLDDKTRGQDFARRIGLRVPETFQNAVSLSEVQPRAGLVVKPSRAASAKGVYCFFSEDRILNIGARKMLSSIDQFLDSAKAASNALGRGDSWIVEELITNSSGNIPNDMKYYCFYGMAHLVLEVDRSGPSFRYCWWNRDGKQIDTGKYGDDIFQGTNFDLEQLAVAEEISLKVPTPFMRIDFLNSADGPVFGEFTPKPGNFQGFDAQTDCWLGKCYVEARARLMVDLMKGKKFEDYSAFVASLKKRKKSRKPAA